MSACQADRWDGRIPCDSTTSAETGDCAATDSGTFSIGILQDDPRGGENRFALGFAMLGTPQANSACAFYSKISALVEAHPGRASVTTVLAYVVVHEIVHMVRRSNRHSHGIMAESWTPKQLMAMEQRQLRFSASEGRELTASLAARP